ncbi:cca [Acrasis kona]|uniref:Cca n=1 Tax=Acrasis kona TaxID=1008807 RepID=A0AAW2YM93_9EUKA
MPQPALTDNGALNLWLLYLDERFDIIEVMLSKTCDLIGNNKRKRYTGSVISSGLTPPQLAWAKEHLPGPGTAKSLEALCKEHCEDANPAIFNELTKMVATRFRLDLRFDKSVVTEYAKYHHDRTGAPFHSYLLDEEVVTKMTHFKEEEYTAEPVNKRQKTPNVNQ